MTLLIVVVPWRQLLRCHVWQMSRLNVWAADDRWPYLIFDLGGSHRASLLKDNIEAFTSDITHWLLLHMLIFNREKRYKYMFNLLKLQ